MDAHCYSTESSSHAIIPLTSGHTTTVNCPPNRSVTLQLPISVSGTSTNTVTQPTIKLAQAKVQELPCSASRRKNYQGSPTTFENGYHDEIDRASVKSENIKADQTEELPWSASRRRNYQSVPAAPQNGYQHDKLSVTVETSTEILDTVDGKNHQQLFKNNSCDEDERVPVKFEMIIPETVQQQRLDCPAFSRKNFK